MGEEIEPRKTREAVFKHIGAVQLPDLLLEVDAATHFSEAIVNGRFLAGTSMHENGPTYMTSLS